MIKNKKITFLNISGKFKGSFLHCKRFTYLMELTILFQRLLHLDFDLNK